MSVVSRILKTQSSTAPPFSKSRNNFKVEIEDGAIYDMQKSYLLLNTDLTTSGDNGVHKVFLGTSVYSYAPDCLIKTARLSCTKNGILEEVHQVNVLNQNLDLVKRGFERNFNINTEFGQGLEYDLELPTITRTAFRNLNLASASSNRKVDLRIPLKKMFGLGWSPSLNTSKTGKLTMAIELEDVLDVSTEYIQYEGVNNLALDDANAPAGGAQITELETTGVTFTDDERLTLWVNSYVKVTYTPTAGAPTTVDRYVTAVSKNVGGKMLITLGVGLGVVDITAVTLVQNPATAINYTINDVQCVLYQKSGKQEETDIVYNTWKLEMVNKPAGTTHYERNFDVEGNCSTAIVMTPLGNSLTSQTDSCGLYRFSINGVDTTDQSIVPHDMLYNDRLMMTFENASMPPASLKSTNTLFCNPIPLVQQNQVLHLKMTHTAPSASPITYLYKLMEREI